MSVEESQNVSRAEINEFLSLLEELNISRRKFCSIVAAEEPGVDEDEIKTKTETYRQRLKRKSMSRFEFQIMQDILAKQQVFIQSNKVYLTEKKGLFANKDFERSMLSAFKSLD